MEQRYRKSITDPEVKYPINKRKKMTNVLPENKKKITRKLISLCTLVFLLFSNFSILTPAIASGSADLRYASNRVTLDTDSDGKAELGETVDLKVTLNNQGTDLASGVYARLSTAESKINITTDQTTCLKGVRSLLFSSVLLS